MKKYHVILMTRMGRQAYFFSDLTKLTEAEIKKDFEWAFQFAKPVEEK